MLKEDQRNSRATIHSQGEQNATQKCSYDVDWLQKKVNYILPQSWIIDRFKLYKKSKLIEKTMKN